MKEVTITTTRELIPINRNEHSFEATFEVVSPSYTPFRALIVNQSLLDSLPENGKLDLKQVPKGIFSGTMREDSGVFDQWYIALEAETPTPVTVQINVRPISSEVNALQPSDAKKGFPWWLYVLIAVGVLLVSFFVWQAITHKKDEVPSGSNPTAEPVVQVPETVPDVPIVPELPVIDVTDLPPL